MESLTEKELRQKYGKEININDKDIIKDVRRIPCENVEESTHFISNLFQTLKNGKKMKLAYFSLGHIFVWVYML